MFAAVTRLLAHAQYLLLSLPLFRWVIRAVELRDQLVERPSC